MNPTDPATSVKILGDEYRLRGGSPELVVELAGFVDGKFREVQTARPGLDLKRLAVMVCMNIAEELYQERSRTDGTVDVARQRVRRFREDLEACLGGPGPPASAPR